MTRLTILVLTATVAFLANCTCNAEAQGNRPTAGQIVGKSVIFCAIVSYGERFEAVPPTPATSDAESYGQSQAEMEQVEDLSEIADFSQAPSELWHLRPAVKDCLR